MRSILATEEQEHLALIEWAQTHPICREYLIHIPNEIRCNAAYGAKRKKLGVKAGVSDFFLAYPLEIIVDGFRYNYGGLWIELKRSKHSKLSLLQKKWLTEMAILGYKACVAYGWTAAKILILKYLGD